MAGDRNPEGRSGSMAEAMALPDTTDWTVTQMVLAGLAIALILLVLGYAAAWAWQRRRG